MPTLAWQKLELFKGILREPSPDGSRLIVWIPGAIGEKAQKWERVSNIAGAETSEDRGIYSTAVPVDAVLNFTDTDVAVTGVYQGRSRMTLTYPIINRSRRILWLVTGKDKAGPLMRLRDADPSIPAGRVYQDQALVLADQASAASLENSRNQEPNSIRNS